MPGERLLVVIVNYRTPDLAIESLRSLVDEMPTVAPCRAVVVDGGSGDGSADRIAAAIEREGWTWASMIPLQENRGFAFANNAAIRRALAESPPPRYTMLLNPDATASPGALATLVEFMDAHPQIGIAGAGVVDSHGTRQVSAFHFHTPIVELVRSASLRVLEQLFPERGRLAVESDVPCRADWVTGAAMVIRREVFADAGLMDDNYFLYFEETDFCLAATRAGWSVWYVPTATVVHDEGQATGIRRTDQRRPAYWFRSRGRFYTKNYGLGMRVAADVALLTGLGIRRIKLALRRRPWDQPEAFARDLVRHATNR